MKKKRMLFVLLALVLTWSFTAPTLTVASEEPSEVTEIDIGAVLDGEV